MKDLLCFNRSKENLEDMTESLNKNTKWVADEDNCDAVDYYGSDNMLHCFYKDVLISDFCKPSIFTNKELEANKIELLTLDKFV